MHLILQHSIPSDYVIATGYTHSLKDFVTKAFNYFNLKWEDHVVVNKDIFRPTDIMVSVGNPAKAEKELGWKANLKLDDIIKNMIEYKLKSDL